MNRNQRKRLIILTLTAIAVAGGSFKSNAAPKQQTPGERAKYVAELRARKAKNMEIARKGAIKWKNEMRDEGWGRFSIWGKDQFIGVFAFKGGKEAHEKTRQAVNGAIDWDPRFMALIDEPAPKMSPRQRQRSGVQRLSPLERTKAKREQQRTKNIETARQGAQRMTPALERAGWSLDPIMTKDRLKFTWRGGKVNQQKLITALLGFGPWDGSIMMMLR